MILACHNISKSFGEQQIVNNGSFHIEEREKTALIGLNGAGKSTLLKMIMKEIPSDNGEVIIAKNKTIGYLSQHQKLQTGNTILEELQTAKEELVNLEAQIQELLITMEQLTGEELEKQVAIYHHLNDRFESENGYAYQSELTGVLKGLGFAESEFNKKVDTLSGGQKTRVSLGKLLLTKPDILLLDEPTNHLDLNSISWLETYLLNYQGAVLIVSHDRYFINRVVTKIIEIENGIITTYLGNYKDFAYKKKMLREAKLKEFLNQQQLIKHQEEVIKKLKSFNREKSIRRAESREKALDKIVPLDKPMEDLPELHFALAPREISGNDVLKVEDLSKSFDGFPLFQHISFEIKRGEHVAIIGDNGTGKTTLLKILNQVYKADYGTFVLGSNVRIGYYDQEHHVLHADKRIFDEISDDYPDLTITQIRTTLAAFLFTGDEVFKLIKDLSGGERGRVSLAKLMLSEANFLILDEPTNHLDIASKEILEKALNEYTGTILYVSHDRYFINQTATRILDLVHYSFVNYIGNYDYYLEKKDTLTKAYTTDIGLETVSSDCEFPNHKSDWQTQKEQQAKERKRLNDLAKAEDQINNLEVRSNDIDQLLTQSEIFTDVRKCLELTEEKASITSQLEALYEQWELLAEEKPSLD
ncbi:MAG: ABC-F family ATP-binding cassette domain-containing protein [Lachnospiraceae bacterium]